jgi:hypothetical protein
MIKYEPLNQTVHQQFYIQVLTKLLERIKKKRDHMWNRGWILHQHNAPAHNAISVRQFLAGKQIPTLEHAPYSQYLTPCDCFLFQKFKCSLNGPHFQSVEDIRKTNDRVT